MNKVYTALTNANTAGGTLFVRAVDSTLERNTDLSGVGELLVPASSDTDYRLACAEQLVQVCRRSSLSSLLQELDPDNTYSSMFPVVEPSSLFTGVPVDCQLLVQEGPAQYPWISRRQVLVFNLGANSVSVDGQVQYFTVAEGLSSSVKLYPDLNIRLQGDIPTSVFVIRTALVRAPMRSLLSIDGAPILNTMEWQDKFRAWMGIGSSVADRMAAVTLNYVDAVLK